MATILKKRAFMVSLLVLAVLLTNGMVCAVDLVINGDYYELTESIANNVVIKGNGTIHNGTASGGTKLLKIQGSFDGFTGTINNNNNRWIELCAISSNSTLSPDGTVGTLDLKGVSLTTTGTCTEQGYAFVTKAGTNKSVYQIDALTTANGTTRLISSNDSSTNGEIEVGYANTDFTLVGYFNHNQDGLSTRNYSLSVNKVGTGTWTWTNNKNQLAGKLRISEGKLSLGNGGTTGMVAFPTFKNETGYITIGAEGALEFNRSDNVNYTGRIETETNKTGKWENETWQTRSYDSTTDKGYITANFVKNGAGTLNLVLSNNASGYFTRLPFDTVSEVERAVIFDANIEIKEGTLQVRESATTPDCRGLALRGDLTGTGILLHTGGDKLILFGDNSQFTGTVESTATGWLEVYRANSMSENAVYNIHGGGNGIAFVGDNETFKLGALVGDNVATKITKSSKANGTITVEVGHLNGENDVFKGSFLDKDGLGIKKVGTGMWTLTNTNLHKGDTVVDSGVLNLARGAELANSKLIVNEGGTLRIAGKAKTLEMNGTLEIDFTGATINDIATVAGNANFGNTARLSIQTGDLTIDELWDASYTFNANTINFAENSGLANMISASVAEGLMSNYWTYSLAAGGNSFTIAMNHGAVPEPGTWVLLVLGLVGLGTVYRKK